MISNKIKQRRLALGYSLQDVVEKLKPEGIIITRACISKYENNKSIPNAKFLWKLSNIFNVPNDYFFIDNKIEIKWFAFRKHTDLTKKIEKRIKNYALEIAESHKYLEDIMQYKLNKVKFVKNKISNIEELEDVAESVRKEWNLGYWAIDSVTQLLEKEGYIVIDYEFENNKFDGLSGITNFGNPVIISKSNIDIDRKRFNLAHELGHQLISCNPEIEEKAAYRFAGAFLIPRECVYNELGEKRRYININELILLKEKYGISVQALTKRCFDLGVITKNQYRNKFIHFRKNYWHKNEPGECKQIEKPIKLKQMTLKAVAEGIITEHKAKSLCHDIVIEKNNKSDWKWKDLQNMSRKEIDNVLSKASKIAEDEYKNNKDLDFYNTIGELE